MPRSEALTCPPQHLSPQEVAAPGQRLCYSLIPESIWREGSQPCMIIAINPGKGTWDDDASGLTSHRGEGSSTSAGSSISDTHDVVRT
ncbi:hypothetical protein E2C01_055205 [Portunus trituberculatus]|uniref:Uncharacterized protein n=1 Tax=Portunus trituberculatus TaxID=210409 RepID=A0A5B7GQK4_PORTR|nr:hypothetical protein [Portunus trituberculatus]